MAETFITTVPDNLESDTAFLGIRKRNLLETGVLEGVAFLFFRVVPLPLPVMIIGGISVMGILGILFAIGIRGESITEFLHTLIVYLLRKGRFHMASPNVKNRLPEEYGKRDLKELLAPKVNKNQSELDDSDDEDDEGDDDNNTKNSEPDNEKELTNENNRSAKPGRKGLFKRKKITKQEDTQAEDAQNSEEAED